MAVLSEFVIYLQKRRDALKVRESQLSKQIEDLQKDCLRNLADRQNEVNICELVESTVNISDGQPDFGYAIHT